MLICTSQGGTWVEVPPAATVEEGVLVEVTGESDASGKVVAKVRLEETGDAWGLRDACLHQGAAKLREYILNRLLDLPPTATLTVDAQGDPRETGRPFTVNLTLSHPQGVRVGGGEASFDDGWLRVVPSAIQKPGRPRQSPVASDSALRLRYRATWKVPMPLAPILKEQTGETPFRAFTWKAESQVEAGATTVRLSFEHRSKPAIFGFEEREKGVQAWKKDRILIKRLIADGLAFKVIP